MKHMDCSITHNEIGPTVRGRKLTAILYLNKEWEGGQLRVHMPQSASVESKLANSKTDSPEILSSSVFVADDVKDTFPGFKNTGVLHRSFHHIDIDPLLGRMVIFRRCICSTVDFFSLQHISYYFVL